MLVCPCLYLGFREDSEMTETSESTLSSSLSVLVCLRGNCRAVWMNNLLSFSQSKPECAARV